MRNSTNAVVTWSAINGRRYVVHYKSHLNDPQWNNAALAVPATGSTFSLTNSVGSDTNRVYRIELLPVQPPS